MSEEGGDPWRGEEEERGGDAAHFFGFLLVALLFFCYTERVVVLHISSRLLLTCFGDQGSRAPPEPDEFHTDRLFIGSS